MKEIQKITLTVSFSDRDLDARTSSIELPLHASAPNHMEMMKACVGSLYEDAVTQFVRAQRETIKIESDKAKEAA